MRIRQITETPVKDLEALGRWDRQGGFKSPADKRLATTPAVQDRVRNFFSRSPYDFRLYPINVPGGSRLLETGEVESMEWLEKNLPLAARTLEQQPVQDDEIVIFYTNNTGDQRVPFTPWMMAHRMGHAFRASDRNSGIQSAFNNIHLEMENTVLGFLSRHYPGNPLYGRSVRFGNFYIFVLQHIVRALFAHIGTMRSARSVNQYARGYEFIYELFAQWINSGHIKFNPLPSTIKYRSGNVRRKYHDDNSQSLADWSDEFKHLAATLEYYFDSILDSAQGRVYMM